MTVTPMPSHIAARLIGVSVVFVVSPIMERTECGLSYP